MNPRRGQASSWFITYFKLLKSSNDRLLNQNRPVMSKPSMAFLHKVYYMTMLITLSFLITQCHSEKYLSYSDFIVRDGLGNSFAKLEKVDTFKVAYLGGSITAQPGWRIYSQEWLSKQYPGAAIAEINAAIGGTGSSFGVYRLREQVLVQNPNLVFVEFAVNDAKAERETIIKSMEGIVRQIRQYDSEIDICFVYTIMEDFINAYKKDSLPLSVATMEQVAEHYGIPSINFGSEVMRRVAEGEVLFKGDSEAKDTINVFSSDGIHPHPESGHKIYRDVFVKAFEAMQKGATHKLTLHDLGEPLSDELLMNTMMASWTEVDSARSLETVFVEGDPNFDKFSRYMQSVGKGDPGDEISFRFGGSSFGFFDIMGPGTGTVEVTVDGEKSVYSRFDKYCTFWRISYKTFDGLSDSIHTVSIKVLDQEVDKMAILKENDRALGDEDYSSINWYLSKILINGYLVE